MNYHFYESKIIYILITALIFIQFGSYYALRINNQNVVQATIRDELTTSSNVFHRLLELRNRQLKQATQILVGDYGFRESVATQDRSTIESMLNNHGRRVEASLLILTDTNQKIIATVPPTIETQSLKAANVFSMPPEETAEKEDITIAAINLAKNSVALKQPAGANVSLFQVISTAVRTPLPTATLTIGYPVNDNFAKDLSQVTGTEFVFFSRYGSDWKLHASSLPENVANQFKPSANHNNHTAFKALTIDAQSYLATPIVLNGVANHEIIAIAAKPISKVIFTFKKIERMFIYLLIVTLLLSLIAIYLVTRRMIRPLNDLAHLDNLTGLGNRRLFNTLLDKMLADLTVNNKPFALFFMDLNKFKQINDTLGHDVGDIVLQASAKRIKEAMRNSDNIIRLGGDEFAVIVEDGSRKSLQVIAEKIAAAIAEPIAYNNTFIEVGVSIGIAIAPLDAHNKFDLMKGADEAMYIAKTTHVNHFFFGDKQYQ